MSVLRSEANIMASLKRVLISSCIFLTKKYLVNALPETACISSKGLQNVNFFGPTIIFVKSKS